MSNTPKILPTINVTPLIDVLLVLLIIFMVITPVKPHRFNTIVPEKPRDEAAPPPPSLLVVTIDGARQLTLNSEPIGVNELGAKLQAVLSARASDQHTLFIKAPRQLPYEYVVNVIDLVKGAGASPIGLQVDYLEGV